MMRISIFIASILVVLLFASGIAAQDADETVPYFQARGFNAPILEGWANQSTEEIAQFHLAAARATIRAALVEADDALGAVEAEIRSLTGSSLGQPFHSGKVNLADGTWSVFVSDIDAATTASVMARRAGRRFVLISFIEEDPVARVFMLAAARADESATDASPEIAGLAPRLLFPPADLEQGASLVLPSGEWVVLSDRRYTAMGMVFGNDSFLAFGELAGETLPTLADAYNRTLLGFFITPDNSLYLALGLAATFIILGLLIFSYFWRGRTMRQELALLNALAQEDD